MIEQSRLNLSIVTPVRKLVFNQLIREVFIPATMGELNILPGHAPLMSLLSTGILKYIGEDGSAHSFVISWGYCEVVGKEVSVLAETVETTEEIDAKRAELALQDAKKRLEEAGLGSSEFNKYLRKVERAEARISAATQNKN